MTTRMKPALWVFYGGLSILLLLITTGVLGQLIPSQSTRISYNSEAYHFAVVLAAWVQFALPRLSGRGRMPCALGIGAFWAIVGIGLLASDFPSRIRTLNESALALAITIPYVSMKRPLGRWHHMVTPILVVLTVWAVVWAPQSWIIDQAETFGFVTLAVLTFDVFDRTLLDPAADVNRKLRATWYTFMILEPVVVSGLGTEVRAGGGGVALTLEYLGRIHESFVGVLLVALILHLVRRLSHARSDPKIPS